MTSTVRLHGLDVLRGVAMLLGVVLHASIAYQAGVRMVPWIDDTIFHSYVFDWLYLCINSFRMQLFFALAGFFSHLVVERKGVPYFIRNRSLRIVVPFVLSYFIILPATLAPFWYYQFSLAGGDPFQQTKASLVQFFLFRNHWGGVMHLWFLYHLIVFYVGVIVWQKFQPIVLPRLMPGPRSVKYPGIAVLAVALVTGLLAQFYPSLLPTIWTGFKPPVIQVVYYGFFFFCGWTLFNYKTLLTYFDSRYKLFITVGLVLSLLHTVVLNTYFPSGVSVNFTGVIFKVTLAIQTIALSVGCIGLFNTWFARPNAVGQYFSDAAYWVYLIHLPLVALSQLLLLHSDVPGILRFPIVLIASIAIAILSYQLLVRNTWIGLLLNGKK